MSRNYQLTEDQKPVTGMFWVPGDEGNLFPGTLHMAAGKRARLTTCKFNYAGWSNLIPGVANPKKGESVKLQGAAAREAMRLPSHPVLNGHDENGREITLIHATSSSSQSTLAMSSLQFSCQAGIFGSHVDPQTSKFGGIRLRVDHLDEWVGRCAFQHQNEVHTDQDGNKSLSKITIPIARDLSIPLQLKEYQASRFFCSWGMSNGTQRFELKGKVYLDLLFEEPLDWWALLKNVHKWEWFFSLATRDTLDLSSLELFPVVEEPGTFPVGSFDVWLKRRNKAAPVHPKRTSHDFHFSYDDVENDFARIVANWQRLQRSWETVLHRFFAVTAPRDLWMNERFLFLAQAIESMHRAKSGGAKQNLDLNKAAKMAWENAPAELQSLLGKKSDFINQFRKTRNYWTHYGEPSPRTDADVLDDTDLMYFSEKLRFLVETNLLSELGLPDHCIAKVWSDQWRMRLIDFTK